MTNKQIYEELLAAADSEIKQWLKADKITPIEQALNYMPVVSGIARAALFLLPTDMYEKWKKEVKAMGGLI